MWSRTEQAKIKTSSIHAFRWWYALACLRAGANVYSIQELMGHADLHVLIRYLKQTKDVIRIDYIKVNPIDNIV